jgi:putative FmdB family regulatory protein
LALSWGECQRLPPILQRMPIYEYRCENDHSFDVMQRMSEDPLTSCEVCGAPAQRVLHAPAVHFKGSGFYNTDYGTKKRARELKSAGDGKATGESTSRSETKSGGDSGTSSSDAGSSSGGSRSESPKASTSS